MVNFGKGVRNKFHSHNYEQIVIKNFYGSEELDETKSC